MSRRRLAGAAVLLALALSGCSTGEEVRGGAEQVTEFLRSMPSGPDLESFEITGDEGTLVLHYGERATEVDPAVLRETMEQVAAQAKERAQNLQSVEFRVGDRTYTF